MKNIYDKLNEHYREVVDKNLNIKFGNLGFKTGWNLLSMSLTTSWSKKVSPKLRKEIKDYITGYSDGYVEAMNFTGAR